jgi:membrane protease YdiL (CAAX protease family)
MKSECDGTGSIATRSPDALLPRWGAPARSLLKTPSVNYGPGDDHPVRLFFETVAVTILTVAAVKWLLVQNIVDRQWLLIPAVLAFAGTIPGWLLRRDFPPLGLQADSIRHSLLLVAWVCGCTFPLMVAGLWWARQMHWPIPLAPTIHDRPDWLAWLLYQFLYVAVAEEVFFRGYVQNNVMRWCRRMPWRESARWLVALGVSAGCFAVAHAVVQGHALPLLTFFPGLLMAWMFLRSGCLLAPILFHGLANVAYGLTLSLLS